MTLLTIRPCASMAWTVALDNDPVGPAATPSIVPVPWPPSGAPKPRDTTSARMTATSRVMIRGGAQAVSAHVGLFVLSNDPASSRRPPRPLQFGCNGQAASRTPASRALHGQLPDFPVEIR